MSQNLNETKTRNLFLSAQVNQESILNLSKALIEINEHDRKTKKLFKIEGLKYTPKPIKIYIDTYGGNVYQCFGLLGLMKSSITPIHTIVTGCAMSCGFMIAITGHKRFAYEKATLLYHQVSAGAFGKLKEIEEEVIEIKRLQKMIEDHTLAYTAISPETLADCFDKKEDWYISVEEALKLKIIDKII